MSATTATHALTELVAAVPDPELPVVTIGELGILRAVEQSDDGRVTVTVTPTYSGCPAMHAIDGDIRRTLLRAGHPDVEVRTQLAPAWTTDWMSGTAKRKLADAGIAPPGRRSGAVGLRLSVRCPRCGSPDTEELSRFGSTACTALWRCRGCAEPFDHVKVL